MQEISQIQQKNLRELFIKEFVWRLIKNTKVSVEKDIEKKLEEETQKESLKIQPTTKPIARQSPQLTRIPKPLTPLPQQKQMQRVPIAPHIPPSFRVLPLPQTPLLIPKQRPQQIQKKEKIEDKINLGKIAPLLFDPTVISIECPGPTRNLIVNKGGEIQASSITLAREEIDSLLREISDKTRIPLVPGVFKTVYKDIIITAVISEFVGTRFLIQKRTPFKPY